MFSQAEIPVPTEEKVTKKTEKPEKNGNLEKKRRHKSMQDGYSGIKDTSEKRLREVHKFPVKEIPTEEERLLPSSSRSTTTTTTTILSSDETTDTNNDTLGNYNSARTPGSQIFHVDL